MDAELEGKAEAEGLGSRIGEECGSWRDVSD